MIFTYTNNSRLLSTFISLHANTVSAPSKYSAKSYLTYAYNSPIKTVIAKLFPGLECWTTCPPPMRSFNTIPALPHTWGCLFRLRISLPSWSSGAPHLLHVFVLFICIFIFS
jgi:hypothetical protein